jgi:hypothetical protein
MNVLYHRGGGVSILNKSLLSALRCNEEQEKSRIWDGVILDKISIIERLYERYRVSFKDDGFAKSPTSALHCILRHCDVL